jgi:succinyl-CoA synthetase beta subunit
MFIRNQGGSMNIHEYQAKRLLARFGVPIPNGRIAYTAAEAAAAARAIPGPAWYVKPQRLGSGEAAVVYATTPEAVAAAADRMLEPGPANSGATRVLVEEALPEGRAFALVIGIDPEAGRIACWVGSSLGANDPAGRRADLDRLLIDPTLGLHPHHARRLADRLGLAGAEAAAFGRCLGALYEALLALDAIRIEIDPLIAQEGRGVVAVGIAMAVDDCALHRQPEIQALRGDGEEDEAEREAERNGLNYLRLKGSIGCLANGAGLAMATMDSVRSHGGAPANFLDIGGGVTHERVAAAFKLVLADPHVEGVLVNVFGGIVRCEVIAEGIIAAAREVGLHVPLVVRMEGTNVELGRKLLRQSGLPIISADTIDEAAARVVAAVREAA